MIGFACGETAGPHERENLIGLPIPSEVLKIVLASKTTKKCIFTLAIYIITSTNVIKDPKNC